MSPSAGPGIRGFGSRSSPSPALTRRFLMPALVECCLRIQISTLGIPRPRSRPFSEDLERAHLTLFALVLVQDASEMGTIKPCLA